MKIERLALSQLNRGNIRMHSMTKCNCTTCFGFDVIQHNMVIKCKHNGCIRHCILPLVRIKGKPASI